MSKYNITTGRNTIRHGSDGSVTVNGEPVAEDMPEPADEGACSCWATSRKACPKHGK